MDLTLDEFLSYTNLVSDLVMMFVVLDVLALFVMVFLERCDPRVFVTWLILMFLLPPVGFILYLYLGISIYNRRRFDPKNVTDMQILEAVVLQNDMLEKDRRADPEEEAVRIATAMKSAGAWTYTNNNDIELFTEGDPLFRRMMEDIAAAERTVLIEYYIVRNDHDGNEFVDLLRRKAEEGVEVRFLTDAFGIGKGPKDGIYRFRRAGGHYAMFHRTVTLLLSPKKNNRNHRKIAVIDGRVAYCGGFNIGDEYRGEGPLGHWRDATVRVEGAGIVPMVARFCGDWQYSAPRDLLRPIDEYIDPSVWDHQGVERMQFVSGGPDTMPGNPVRMQYMTMVSEARRRLYVATPYLGPDEAMATVLENAAKSGVDVRVLIPDKKDHIFLYWNNLTCADRLMRSGVRVWRYNDGFVHEKMMLIDDTCCSIGSANLDNRSMRLNFESNAMIYSQRINAEAAEQFLADLERSTEYSCRDYAESTPMERIRMAVSWQMRLLARSPMRSLSGRGPQGCPRPCSCPAAGWTSSSSSACPAGGTSAIIRSAGRPSATARSGGWGGRRPQSRRGSTRYRSATGRRPSTCPSKAALWTVRRCSPR